jgi:soluble lytic murein transglycosylase-like protein
VPADLIEGLGWVESGWQRNVISKTGAKGIGQLMPATVEVCWKLIGVPLDPMNASDNIRMTARFLRYLLDATGGAITTTLAAYYQGLRAVRHGPILAETLVYVATVTAVRPAFR